LTLEDARFTVYEEDREEKVTYVSTCGLQKQSNKGKQSSNEVVKSTRLYTEHKNSYHLFQLSQRWAREVGG